MYVVEHNQTAKPCDSGAVNKHNGFRITWAKDPTLGLKRWRKKSLCPLVVTKKIKTLVILLVLKKLFTDSPTKGNSQYYQAPKFPVIASLVICTPLPHFTTKKVILLF